MTREHEIDLVRGQSMESDGIVQEQSLCRSREADAAATRAVTEGRAVAEDFSYSSDSNSDWLSVERLREMVADV